MKKPLVLILILFSSITMHAQTIGVRGGLNLGNAVAKTPSYTLDTKTGVGFQLGLTLEAPISEALYFNTALLYTSKPYKYTIIVEFTDINNFLELPLNIEYKESIGDANIFVEAGPYLAYGLSSKIKTGDTTLDRDYGSDSDDIKRLDAGLNFGAGVEFEKLRLGLNYAIGLTSLSNDDDETYKMRNFALYAVYNIN